MTFDIQSGVNLEVRFSIIDFLYHEAYLLDNGMYKEWLELLSEDLVYQMPLRVTIEGRKTSNLSSEMYYYDESKKALTTRVNRLYTNSAWVERTPPRQRHFISNIVVEATGTADEYKVRSYFLFKRSRGADAELEEMFGERHDVIRQENGQWKISSRSIYPDQAVMTVMNMSMFL